MENIRAVFKKELDIPIVEIADQNAKLDGGDVLFTGKITFSFTRFTRNKQNHFGSYRKGVFRRIIAMDE